MNENSVRLFLNLALAVLLPVLLLGTLRIAFMRPNHETSDDAYWHVAAGNRPLRDMVAKKFPIQNSIWKDHFGDKELVYHLILKAYVETKSLLNLPLTAPFQGPFLFFTFLFFLAFVLSAWKLGVSPPDLLPASLICASLIPNFTYRLFMVRPQVLSMAMMLVAYLILGRNPAKRSTALWILALSFLYSWSYSSPHLIWVTAFLFGAVYCFRGEGMRSFLSFGASILGVFLGLLIHPQSPNTFYVWKVQALDALLAPITGGKIYLPFARELMAPSASWIWYALPALIALYFCVMVLCRARECGVFGKIPSNTLAMMVITLFWSVLMCSISLRPVEYAIPALCISGILLLRFSAAENLFPVLSSRRNGWILLISILILSGGFTFYNNINNLRKLTIGAPYGVAAKLRELEKQGFLRPGEHVVNLDWSDFPGIYFCAPEYTYTWALDPMFSHAFDPGKTGLLGDASSAKRVIRPSEMRSVMNANFAVLIGERRDAIGFFLVRRCGWRLLYRDKDGWIFYLR